MPEKIGGEDIWLEFEVIMFLDCYNQLNVRGPITPFLSQFDHAGSKIELHSQTTTPFKLNALVCHFVRIRIRNFYKERNQTERMFKIFKEFRRVATRYDKLLQNFMSFVKIAAIQLKGN